MEDFLNHLIEIFNKLKFSQTSFMLMKEMQEEYPEDIAIL